MKKIIYRLCWRCNKNKDSKNFYTSLHGKEEDVCETCKFEQISISDSLVKVKLPMIRFVGGGWSGACGSGGLKMDVEDLEKELAEGKMTDERIENLVETESGEKLVDKYINHKFNEGKHIERMTGGVFNHKDPDGTLSRTTQFDQHTGKQLAEELG